MNSKVKVIIAQLGSPKSTKVGDVRDYLREFLSDPRVIDTTPWVWKIILYLFILPFRPKKSAQAYSRIETPEGFPLINNTIAVYEGLKPHLDANIDLDYKFLLSSPRLKDVMNKWDAEDAYTRASKFVFLPQFPQYSESTIASAVDGLGHEFKNRVNIPSFEMVNFYHRSRAFIDHSVKRIQETLKNNPGVEVLFMSFHGIPLRRVVHKKDVYLLHCMETFELIKQRLHLDIPVKICFQSRFGSEVWLGPYTDESVTQEIKNGIKKVAVYSPSFVVDCLETTDEIGNELGHEVKVLGGELIQIPCLNNDPEWIKDYAKFINVTVNGSSQQKEELYYQIDLKERYQEVMKEEEKKTPAPMSKETKGILKVVFLTMFLDLIGFSIIFPMFPAMSAHYLSVDADNFFLSTIMNIISSIQNATTPATGAPLMSTIVLFGGLLGAIYSLLQFVAAPIWGGISDRIGRRPVLLISVFGLFISYLIWIFSGSFTLLILARFIGGIMSGNLSIASAVVSDVTDEQNRSKGMAIIGIAFAFGFVFGPAFGGILSLYNPLVHHPEWAFYGVNPFSLPALFAAVLCLINFVMVWKMFPETKKFGEVSVQHKSINPLKLFRPLPYAGVNATNLAYFFFITAFSGMEFTLTFLAVERLSFTSMDNAYMFIYIGFIIAFVQGGYVRRRAHQVGEKKMSVHGLICIIPGLVILAFAHSKLMLYFGLAFLAMGSAMIIPCLTSLVSFYTPRETQGRSLGIFRSLGSLGRVIGPIYASLVYWRYGSVFAYMIGAITLLIPLVIVRALPAVKKGE